MCNLISLYEKICIVRLFKERLLDLLQGKLDRIHAPLHPDYWSFSEEYDLPAIYRKITDSNCKIMWHECELLIQQNYDYLLRSEQLDRERQEKYTSSLC